MKNLFQFINNEGEYVGLFMSDRSLEYTQRIVSEFYEMEIDGDRDVYLEERKIYRVFADEIHDY